MTLTGTLRRARSPPARGFWAYGCPVGSCGFSPRCTCLYAAAVPKRAVRSTQPQEVRPVLAMLSDGPFDDSGSSKISTTVLVVKIEGGKSHALQPQRQDHQPQLYQGARALEGLNGDAVKDEAVTTWCQTLAGGRGQVHRMDDKRRNAASRLSWTSRGLAVTGLPVGTRKTA